jgi:hypothetical protein
MKAILMSTEGVHHQDMTLHAFPIPKGKTAGRHAP